MDQEIFDTYKFKAQIIIAQWIVDGYDFIYIKENGDYYPCIDPEDADENPNKYIPFWYEHEQEAVNRLAGWMRERNYTAYEKDKWV